MFSVLILAKGNKEIVYTVGAFLYVAPSQLRSVRVYSKLGKKEMWLKLEVSELGIVLRENSAAPLETLQNRLYNWILQETLTIGILHNMPKW